MVVEGVNDGDDAVSMVTQRECIDHMAEYLGIEWSIIQPNPDL